MSNQYPPSGSGQGPADEPDQTPAGSSPPPPPPPPPSEPQWNPQSPGTPPPPGYGDYQGQSGQQGQYDQQYGAPPPGYSAPGAPGGYGMPQKTNPLAIVSLVSGIVGFLCCTWFVLGIAAAITGFLARKQINENPQQYKGAGLATAGLVLGVISIIAGIVMWILIASGSLDSNFYMETG